MFKVNFDLNLDFFKSKSPPLIGVDISSSSVKMVELSLVDKETNTYRLEQYAIEPLPAGAMLDGAIVNLDAVSDCISRGWSRMATRLKNVALALPASDVITKKIIVPAGLREADLAFQVENEAGQYIPFALDEVDIDFQVLGPVPNNSEEINVLIAASRKDKVEDRVAAAMAAGLKTIVMDVEPYAAQSTFELIASKMVSHEEDQIIALVDIGSSAMNVNVFHGNDSVYMRDQSFGGNQLTQEIRKQFNLSLEESEAAKRNGELPENYRTDILQPFCERLAIEVMRAIQFFYTSTQYTQVNQIFLAGGCVVIPGLDKIIASRTQVSTLVVNPFSSMEFSTHITPRQLSLDAPSLLIACGLAMRSFDPS